MYCYQQIRVKYLEVIYTSIIKKNIRVVSLYSYRMQVDIGKFFKVKEQNIYKHLSSFMNKIKLYE